MKKGLLVVLVFLLNLLSIAFSFAFKNMQITYIVIVAVLILNYIAGRLVLKTKVSLFMSILSPSILLFILSIISNLNQLTSVFFGFGLESV